VTPSSRASVESATPSAYVTPLLEAGYATATVEPEGTSYG
jgi:hypothetical protein